jgi:5-methylcytosine-specific restriction endonuclease McrA
MYLLTNPLTTISGVYQITMDRIAFDTGYDERTLGPMFERFAESGKAFFYNAEWMVMPSWPRHQKWEARRKIMLGIVSSLQELPRDLLVWLDSCGYQFDLSLVAGVIIAGKERQTISGSKRQKIIEAAGGRCEVCGALQGLVLHHRQPLEAGGSNAEGNIQVLCTVCHGKEHSPDSLTEDMWTKIDKSRYLTNYLDPDLKIELEGEGDRKGEPDPDDKDEWKDADALKDPGSNRTAATLGGPADPFEEMKKVVGK